MSQPLRLVILGDSVTAGGDYSGVTFGSCYTQLLRERLSSSVAFEVIPSALEGVDTGYALKRFDRMVAIHHPDVVLVMLGLNDAQPPGGRQAAAPTVYRQNLLQLTDRIMAIDAKPVLSTPTPRLDVAGSPSGSGNIMHAYMQAVHDVADDHHLTWIDVYSRFCSDCNVEALIPDGVHPGPRGHAIIAELFAETLQLLCGEMSVGERRTRGDVSEPRTNGVVSEPNSGMSNPHVRDSDRRELRAPDYVAAFQPC